MVIVVRAHAGEPSFVFKRLPISVHEFCTDTDLTSPFILLSFHTTLIPDLPEHGIRRDFDAARAFAPRTKALLNELWPDEQGGWPLSCRAPAFPAMPGMRIS